MAEHPDANKAAKLYEEELCEFFKLGSGQLPRFDCLLLGMGTDGHTASLFPGTDAIQEQTHLVVANWLEQLQTFRITLTLPVLNNADFVIFIVGGNEKAEMLKRVLEGREQSNNLPSQLIKPTHGKLLWLVDQAAASQLTHS